MESPFSTTAISVKSSPKDPIIEWGPGGFFAVASEQIVTIYRRKNREINIFRTISKHKSNITKIRFNHPSVEIISPDSFILLLAVSDKQGNCLIYDVFTGERHSGISPDSTNQSSSIVDISWSLTESNVLYVLAQNPSLISFTIGSTSKRRSSFIEDCSQHGLNIKTYNMVYKWSLSLKSYYSYIVQDPFTGLQLVLASTNSQYLVVELKSNTQPRSISSSGYFIEGYNPDKRDNERKSTDKYLSNIEYFPNSKGKLVLYFNNGYSIYDIKAKKLIQIFSDPLGDVCPLSGSFSAQNPKEFWSATVSGVISKFVLKDGVFTQKRILQATGVRIQTMRINPLDPMEALAYCCNGRIVIIKDDGNKIFIEYMLPETPDYIVAWTPTKNGLIYATNTGLIIASFGKKKLRFDLADKKIYKICYRDETNDLIIGGSKLYFIDLNTRIIEEHPKYTNPKNLVVSGNLIALCPMGNVIDIFDQKDYKLTCIFAENIKLFVPNDKDTTKWAVFINNISIILLDTAEKEIKQTKIMLNEAFGDITYCAYSGERIIALSSRGQLYDVNTEKHSTHTVSFGETLLKKVRLNDSKALIVDGNSQATLLDINTMRPISYAKWKILDAEFISDKFAMIQTSPYSIKIVQLPQFDTFTMKIIDVNDYRQRFKNAQTAEEMEQIAYEVGDSDFLHLSQLLRQSDSLVCCGVLDIPHKIYKERFACSSAIDRLCNALKENYIDYLILTNDLKKASQLLIEQKNEKAALFAHCCLAPSKEASISISKVPGLEKLAGRLLAICGEREEALEVLINADLPETFAFLKMLFNDDESKDLLERFILFDTPQKDIERICAFLKDGQTLIPVLAANHHISAGKLALMVLGDKGPGNIAKKIKCCDFELAQKHIEAEWERGCSITSSYEDPPEIPMT